MWDTKIPGISTKELKILQECRRQNILYREFPLTMGAMTGVSILIAGGKIKKRFGQIYAACVVGYICAVVTLPNKMREKLLIEARDGEVAKETMELKNMSWQEKLWRNYRLLTNSSRFVQEMWLKEKQSKPELRNDFQSPDDVDVGMKPDIDSSGENNYGDKKV